MYSDKTFCRACNYGKQNVPTGVKSEHNGERLIQVFDLGLQPLANDFGTVEHAGYAPLSVLFCPCCTLAQLSVVVDPAILYSEYPYVTSKTKTMQDHFGSLWTVILKEKACESVVEIGSNDGDFLKFANEHGAKKVIGIDPAQNLSAYAIERGIPTICNVFNSDSAYSAGLSIKEPEVIVARHVFGHIDDWHEFMHGIQILAGKDTLLVVEIPYVVDLLNNTEFDTIYHEHLSYISIASIKALLKSTNFHIHNIVRFPIHGGALAVMIRRNDYGLKPDDSVDSFRETITEHTWKSFSFKAKTKISELSKFVNDAVSSGQTVCGFGASAKSTVWINACGFTTKQIKFICDCTPYKQYTLSPGTDIPIVDEGALLRELPDICINFAWNFSDTVIEKNQPYLNHGGQIISPYLT